MNKKTNVSQLPKKEYSLMEGWAIIKSLPNAKFQTIVMIANIFLKKPPQAKPADIITIKKRK